MSVRPEFGPTLPALLASRGWSRRAILLGAAGLVVLAIGLVFVARALSDTEHLVSEGPPAFSLVYSADAFREAQDRGPAELAKLVGRRRGATVTITVRRVEVPPYDGDLAGGYLPLLAEERLDELAEQYGEVRVYEEGKARVNELPGYQIGFDARVGDKRLYGRDTYVFPDEDGATEGVLLSMRRVVRRKDSSAAAQEFADLAKEAYESFALGEDRP